MKHRNSQSGFTLMELLVVLAIIAVLSYLGLTSFIVYKSKAAQSVASFTLRSAKTGVVASTNDVGNLPGPVSTFQDVQGPLVDAAAKAYLPGVLLPRKVQFTAEYDPTCLDDTCQSDFLEVRHCDGLKYTQWIRMGDGTEFDFPELDGGCV